MIPQLENEETINWTEEIKEKILNHLEHIVTKPYTQEWIINPDGKLKEPEDPFQFQLIWLIGGELIPTNNPKLPYDNQYGADPTFYELLIQNPTEFKTKMETEINERFAKTYLNTTTKRKIIFTKFPTKRTADEIKISHIRTKDLNKGKYITGIIKRKTPIYITTEAIQWECPNCATTTTTHHKEEQKIPNTKVCPKCYPHKSYMKPKKYERTPIYHIELEEEPNENYETTRITCTLKEGLAEYKQYEKTKIGDKISLFGTPRLTQKEEEKNKETIIFQTLGIQTYTEENNSIKPTKEDIQTLEKLKQEHPDLIKYWATQLYTAIHGHEQIKETIIAQLVGNPQSQKQTKTTRGDIHILLIGDAGSCKSTLLKITQKYAIKSRYTTGGGASAVGITGGVVKDELTGGWTAEAGAMPLSHKGILILDEIDKISQDEQNKMHEALEQQTISIDKANIHITLPCQTSLLSAGNPKKSNIDPNQDIYEQIPLPIPFINRMDIIWIIQDKYHETNDTLIANKILQNTDEQDQTQEPITLFKKYQIYAKNINTTIKDEHKKQIIDWYIKVRQQINNTGKGMRLNTRSIEALSRLITAHARANLRNETNEEDLIWAKKIYLESMSFIGIDTITGEIDIQKFETGTSYNEKQIMTIILNLLNSKLKPTPFEDIRQILDQKITDREIETLLSKLKREGSIFEPKNGNWSIIK